MVQETASESEPFTQRAAHHHATPQHVQAPREELVEDKLEESETEGLIGIPEIIGPSLETFTQLPLPSTQPSIIPCLSPSQGQAPLQPSTPQPPKLPPIPNSTKIGQNVATPRTCLSNVGPIPAPGPNSAGSRRFTPNTNLHPYSLCLR